MIIQSSVWQEMITRNACTLQHSQQQQGSKRILQSNTNVRAEIYHQRNYVRWPSPSLVSEIANNCWRDAGHNHVRCDRQVDISDCGSKIAGYKCDHRVTDKAAERGESSCESNERNDIDFFPFAKNGVGLCLVGEISLHFFVVRNSPVCICIGSHISSIKWWSGGGTDVFDVSCFTLDIHFSYHTHPAGVLITLVGLLHQPPTCHPARIQKRYPWVKDTLKRADFFLLPMPRTGDKYPVMPTSFLMSHIKISVETANYQLCSSFSHTCHLSLNSHPTLGFQITESRRCHGG